MNLLKFLPKLSPQYSIFLIIPILFVPIIYFYQNSRVLGQQISKINIQKADVEKQSENLGAQLKTVQDELETLKNDDQVKKNKELEEEINNIHKTYLKSVDTYEKLLELKDSKIKTDKLDKDFAQSLKLLSGKKYQEADALLDNLNKKIQTENDKAQAAIKIPVNVVADNTPPSSGYRRQTVQTDSGSFLVDVISADLGSTKVLVDTASDGDCANDCPVLTLSDYVSRNGAFAGINGTYFCPSTYPSCAGKTNSFDLLVMNKNKKYLNSDNNIYSTNPAVIFSGNSARFVTSVLQWGRDTGVDSVLSNYPLLVLDNQIQFSGGGDVKFNSKGARSFVGASGSTTYIGVVHNASIAESAKVLKTLGVINALNLDNGGSTALWSGGYKVGPGRNIPNALLFIKK
ncbi:MAG: phosphodiester glycosidase family protein [bacterium]|nr:phosphodiester glycosidase family protein [bacterium]